MTQEQYHFANMRELLTQGFSDQELRNLCFDVPGFRPVYEDIGEGTGKAIIVAKLLDHAERTLQVDILLALAKDLNPARYEQHQPYYLTDPIPPLQKQLARLARQASASTTKTSGIPPLQMKPQKYKIGFVNWLRSKWTILLLSVIGVVAVIAALLGNCAPNIWTRVFPPSVGAPIEFGTPNGSNELNPVFRWQQGASTGSSYRVGQLSLMITTGSGTNQWGSYNSAPMVTYPVKGDFETQVTVVFEPIDHHYAGIGIRSTEDSTTWLRVTRAHDEDDVVAFSSDREGKNTYHDYSYFGNVVYFKIVRQRNLFDLFYCSDGHTWNPITPLEFDMPDNVEIYLVALSTGGDIATAQFQDFKVIRH